MNIHPDYNDKCIIFNDTTIQKELDGENISLKEREGGKHEGP